MRRSAPLSPVILARYNAPDQIDRDRPMTVAPQDQARILVEALPHMQQYDEEIVVVKYGGHAMGD
jgi:hypothetical protein